MERKVCHWTRMGMNIVKNFLLNDLAAPPSWQTSDLLYSYLKILSCMFIAAMLVGAFVVPGISLVLFPYPDFPPNIDTLNENLNKDPLTRFPDILAGNLITALILIFIGILGFDVIPIFWVTFNGFVLGGGYPWGMKYGFLQTALWSVFPHATIEMPALILAAACSCIIAERISRARKFQFHYFSGSQSFFSVFKSFVFKDFFASTADYISAIKEISVLGGISFALIIIASVVESWITPQIVHMMVL